VQKCHATPEAAEHSQNKMEGEDSRKMTCTAVQYNICNCGALRCLGDRCHNTMLPPTDVRSATKPGCYEVGPGLQGPTTYP
jgi:hypothetical protein